MLLLNDSKKLELVNSKPILKVNQNLNNLDNTPLDNSKHIAHLSDDTFALSNNFYQSKKPNITIVKKDNDIQKISGLSDPRLLELELTPNAKIYIKLLLSPFATITYILHKASVAFNKTVAAAISFLVFNLMNVFSSSTLGTYEVKLPILTICLVGSIIGARDLVKSIKKIILSIPEGFYACSLNIFYDDCSIFEFICGTDKRASKGLFKKIFHKNSL